jgi:hypothetical protein
MAMIPLLPLRIVIAAVFYCCAAGDLAFGSTILIEPPTLTVNQNQTFSLDISVESITDLYAYQFDVSFDPLILSALSIDEGSFLQGGGATFYAPGTIDNGSGTVNLTANTLLGPGPGIDGTGILATLWFKALNPVTTTVSLLNVQLLDSNINEISAPIQNSTTVTVQDVPTPPVVPTPSELGFFASALPIIFYLSTRRRKHERIG